MMGNVGKLLLRLVWIRRNGLSWCRRPRCSRSLGSYWAIVGRTRNASTGTRRPPLAGDHAGLWAVDAKLRVVARTVTRCGAAILGRAPRVTWPHCRHGPLNDISSGRPRCSLRDLSRDGSSGAGESRGSRWRVHGQRARHRGSHARLLGLGRALLVLRRPYAAWRHRALRWWLHSHRAERVVVMASGLRVPRRRSAMWRLGVGIVLLMIQLHRRGRHGRLRRRGRMVHRGHVGLPCPTSSS